MIESGERKNPGIETLNALAVALGCELRDLYKPGGGGESAAG